MFPEEFFISIKLAVWLVTAWIVSPTIDAVLLWIVELPAVFTYSVLALDIDKPVDELKL